MITHLGGKRQKKEDRYLRIKICKQSKKANKQRFFSALLHIFPHQQENIKRKSKIKKKIEKERKKREQASKTKPHQCK